MAKIKPIVWKPYMEGHLGKIGEFEVYIKHGWSMSTPFEFGADSFAELKDAKKAAETWLTSKILSALE